MKTQTEFKFSEIKDKVNATGIYEGDYFEIAGQIPDDELFTYIEWIACDTFEEAKMKQYFSVQRRSDTTKDMPACVLNAK